MLRITDITYLIDSFIMTFHWPEKISHFAGLKPSDNICIDVSTVGSLRSRGRNGILDNISNIKTNN